MLNYRITLILNEPSHSLNLRHKHMKVEQGGHIVGRTVQ